MEKLAILFLFVSLYSTYISDTLNCPPPPPPPSFGLMNVNVWTNGVHFNVLENKKYVYYRSLSRSFFFFFFFCFLNWCPLPSSSLSFPPVPPVGTGWDPLVPCIHPVACSLGEFGPLAGGLIRVGRVTVSTLSSMFRVGGCWSVAGWTRCVRSESQLWLLLLLWRRISGWKTLFLLLAAWELEAPPTSPQKRK